MKNFIVNVILAPQSWASVIPDSLTTQAVAPGPAESASCGCWLERQNVIPYLDYQLTHAFLPSAKSTTLNLRNAHVKFSGRCKTPRAAKEFRIAGRSRAIHGRANQSSFST